jgi:predicted NUDIX family phosphoesterase
VKVEKSSLVAMLLEVGEENTAVLLARSQLSDEVDIDHDLDTLITFGLERDQVAEVSRLAVGAIEPDDANTRRKRGELEKTIARRWADLVDQWLSQAKPETRL